MVIPADSELPTIAPTRCANCGADRIGPYCAACGQPAVQRLTMRGLAGRLPDVFDLDRGLFGTAVGLFRRPGEIIRDYLRGRTVPFTHPVKYFAIVLSLVQVAALASGMTGGFASGFAEGGVRTAEQASAIAHFIDRFFVLLAAPAVPLLAAIQRAFFRRSAMTYAEHLVVALFVSAQQLLLWLPLLALGENASKSMTLAAALVTFAASVVYYAWTARRVFPGPPVSVVARAIATLLLTGISYLVVVSAVLMAVS